MKDKDELEEHNEDHQPIEEAVEMEECNVDHQPIEETEEMEGYNDDQQSFEETEEMEGYNKDHQPVEVAEEMEECNKDQPIGNAQELERHNQGKEDQNTPTKFAGLHHLSPLHKKLALRLNLSPRTIKRRPLNFHRHHGLSPLNLSPRMSLHKTCKRKLDFSRHCAVGHMLTKALKITQTTSK